ncbi:hypothetical protein L1049_001262 [Liquidambar formosana]|uniref:Uncharacterized protein n=1 Tax=Liquidambar formosana TaxID=63359 RepID=A0AAP0R446_LIQFO
MEPIDDPFVSSSSGDERVEGAVNLLEDCWFFDNLLDRRTKMLRCNSDPCPSSNFSQEMLVRNSSAETSSSMRKLPEEDGHGSFPCNLARTPSLPPCVGRKEGIQTKESDSGINELTHQLSRHSLLRTPSLPPCIGRKESTPDEESDPKISKLTRQASLNPPNALPPRLASKGMIQSSSMPRQRPRRLPRVESINMDGPEEMRRRYLLNQRKMKKSLSDLEYEEVQGFKDLGFKFDKEDLSPSVVNILPGLQEKNRDESDDDKVRRPYLSEAWLLQSSAPPIPNWVANKSAEDMKAQIKFWARAVASNVNQAC